MFNYKIYVLPNFYLFIPCSLNGIPMEETLHWRSFLVKLGTENLSGVKNEELLVACHKYVYFENIIFYLTFKIEI